MRPESRGAPLYYNGCSKLKRPAERLAARAAVVLLLAATIWLALATTVGAHAGLVLAKPSPGSGVAQAPAAVVLKFSEPLNLALSRIEVIDSTGADVGIGPTEGIEGDPTAMQRRLGLLPVGPYTVRWTTVSTLDGHALHGSYRFGVGTSTTGDEQVRDSPLDSEGVLGLLGRFVALVGMGLWVGLAVLANRVAGVGVARSALVMLGRFAPALALLGAALSVVSSSVVASGSVGGLPGVFASGSGQLRGAMLLLASLGVVVGLRSRPLALALAGATILAEAASGHAAAAPLPPLATLTFAVHLGAVGVWLFAILAALLAWPRVRETLSAVSATAIAAAAVVGLSGIASAAFVLSEPHQLVSTDYGRLVLAKSVAFAFMAALGLLHHRLRLDPRRSPTTIRIPVRLEASGALFAMALAVMLVGYPNPPREAEAGDEPELVDPVLGDLRERGALSFADGWGPFVLGLTLLPPEPGPVEFRLHILGLEAGDAPRDARVNGSGPGSLGVQLEPCGLDCFQGSASVGQSGTWEIEATIVTNRGTATISALVPIPAGDGSAELERAINAMESLRSARLEESLRGSTDGPLFAYDYAFQAPDRMRIVFGERERLVIGARDYRRQGAADWQLVDWSGAPFTWPGSYHRDFWANAAAVRLLREETVDGVPSRVVGFVRPELPAWFRIWVGIEDGIVRRMEMRAEGHLMEQEWQPNPPVTIEPPV